MSYGTSYGAILVGGFIALYLSGIVSTQAFMYRRTFTEDRLRIKLMVTTVWLLDLAHSSFVIASVFHYLVGGYTDPTAITRADWSVSATISITGTTTFLIHMFFTYRVWTLSKRNIWLTGLIGLLAFLRLLSAFGTVTQISRLKTWAEFKDHAAWLFTTGLAISATVDFITAFALCYYLQKRRTGFQGMDQVIDSIMLYTVQTGMLTSIVTVTSFICWLTMPHNFVFLALHFCITKMYVNSFLATINARRHLKEKSVISRDGPSTMRPPTMSSNRPLIGSEGVSHRMCSSSHTGDSTLVSMQDAIRTQNSSLPTSTLQINVEKTVQCVTTVAECDPELESLEPAYIRRESVDQSFSDLAKF